MEILIPHSGWSLRRTHGVRFKLLSYPTAFWGRRAPRLLKNSQSVTAFLFSPKNRLRNGKALTAVRVNCREDLLDAIAFTQ